MGNCKYEEIRTDAIVLCLKTWGWKYQKRCFGDDNLFADSCIDIHAHTYIHMSSYIRDTKAK